MITITVQDDQLRAELQRIQRKLGNLTPVMAGIAAALKTAASNRFEIRPTPAAHPDPWPTAARRRRRLRRPHAERRPPNPHPRKRFPLCVPTARAHSRRHAKRAVITLAHHLPRGRSAAVGRRARLVRADPGRDLSHP